MGLQFGFSAVQSGKRVMQSSNEPTLTANSTKAKFSLTGAVTRIMGLVPGDTVQFISNVADIDAAIAERDAEVVAWCEANNVEFGTEASRAALIKPLANMVSVKVYLCSRKTVKLNLLVFV